jgi:beta-lactamase regulating signal transducer with metallopeptidase domain
MGRLWAVTRHAALLALLVAGVVWGVAMLGGYAVMLAGVLLGHMSPAELSLTEIAFGVLMVLLWGGIIVAGLSALWRQCRGSVELAQWVRRNGAAPSARLAAAIERAGLRGRVVQVADASPYAFTYGVWRPRVVASSGLARVATQDELVAVLCHENQHLRDRDPLKVLVLRTGAAAFFLIPLVGAVLQRVLDRQELKADRVAVRDCGVAAVAGALLKTVGEPAVAPGTALAAMGGPTLLEARVAQLETGRGLRMLAPIHPKAVLTSAPGIGLVAGYGVLLYEVCIAVQLCCMR